MSIDVVRKNGKLHHDSEKFNYGGWVCDCKRLVL